MSSTAPSVAREGGTTPGSTDSIGFEIGWDHAHHRLTPPPEHLAEGNPVPRAGLPAQPCFGARTLKRTRHVRQWLRLRLHAWQRGRAFERACR